MEKIKNRFLLTWHNCHLFETMNLDDTLMVEINGNVYWGFGEKPLELRNLGLLVVQSNSYMLIKRIREEMEAKLETIWRSYGWIDDTDTKMLLPQIEEKVLEARNEILEKLGVKAK